MSSRLRYQSSLSPSSAHTTAASFPHAVAQPPQKKQKMSITQTYRIAHTARGKLSSEAARGDHDLRLLVGHANLLDTLMVELQDAERDQERWFNSTVAAHKASEASEPRKVQWVDQIVRDIEEEDEESDSESEADEEEPTYSQYPAVIIPQRRRSRSPEPAISPIEEEDDEELEEDEDADNEELSLVRTHSRYEELEELPQSPPELVHDGEESDDDMPPSPPQPALAFENVIAQDFALKSQKPLVEEGDLLIQETIFGHSREEVPLIAAQA